MSFQQIIDAEFTRVGPSAYDMGLLLATLLIVFHCYQHVQCGTPVIKHSVSAEKLRTPHEQHVMAERLVVLHKHHVTAKQLLTPHKHHVITKRVVTPHKHSVVAEQFAAQLPEEFPDPVPREPNHGNCCLGEEHEEVQVIFEESSLGHNLHSLKAGSSHLVPQKSGNGADCPADRSMDSCDNQTQATESGERDVEGKTRDRQETCGADEVENDLSNFTEAEGLLATDIVVKCTVFCRFSV